MKNPSKPKRAAIKHAASLVRAIDAAVDAQLGSDDAAARVRRYVADHDAPADERVAFERLCFVVFAQGLQWSAIESKRAALKEALGGFMPAALAQFDEAAIGNALSQPIMRNGVKVRTCVDNARRWVVLGNGSPSYLSRIAATAATDDAASGWPALAAMLAGDFARIGDTAARQTLKRWGFFTAFPHPGAQRALTRLGVLEGETSPATAQLTVGAIAQQLGRDPYAVEAVLALFAGLGPCRVTPHCDTCALSDNCPKCGVPSEARTSSTAATM